MISASFTFISLFFLLPSQKIMAETNIGDTSSVKYKTHVQNVGWQPIISDGQLAGTTGQSLRLEGITIAIENPMPGMKIKYQTHVQNVGWQNWVYDGQASGTTGKSLRLEGIKILLEGAPSGYHVQYQVHVQNVGWQPWVQDGELAGTVGQSLRLEGIRIRVINPNNTNLYVFNNYTINGSLQQMYDKEAAAVPVFGNTGSAASLDQIMYYINGSNFKDNDQKLQFMRNDIYVDGISVEDLNSYLSDKGIFKNQAQAFIDAAKQNNISVIYLVAHALWESGLGKTALSNGILVSTVNGQPVEPKVAYNMFGIGAIDANARLYGAEAAYNLQWYSVPDAIKGGANWISKGYIHSSTYKQNTIYKMRWNYITSWHQYATDVHWAYGIASLEKNIIKYCNGATISFDIPNYLQ